MRILLYTGKGGVGKTTVSAATALRCADMGYRTVVVSTDAAHSLADAFDMALGPEPTPVLPNLWGQEIDVLHQMEKHWGNVQRYMATVLAWKGLEGIIAEELTILPGMDELASLLQIVNLYDTGAYDVVIIDCAPTGATLQLLTLPEVGRWYLLKIFPLEKKAVQLSRPLLRAVIDLPMPDDELFDTIEELIRGLDRMKTLLTDPQKSSVRLVLNPEKMVVKEAQRAFTYLSLYGYRTDAVVSNRLIPQTVTDGYFAGWKDIQARYSQLVEEAFAPLPILTVPLFDQEVVGFDMLHRMADAIFGEDDPTRLYYVGQAQQVLKQDGAYQLRIPLPFVHKEDIHLTRSSGDELIVRIGNHKRNILLPHVLATLEVQRAKQEDNWLVITFQEEE